MIGRIKVTALYIIMGMAFASSVFACSASPSESAVKGCNGMEISDDTKDPKTEQEADVLATTLQTAKDEVESAQKLYDNYVEQYKDVKPADRPQNYAEKIGEYSKAIKTANNAVTAANKKMPKTNLNMALNGPSFNMIDCGGQDLGDDAGTSESAAAGKKTSIDEKNKTSIAKGLERDKLDTTAEQQAQQSVRDKAMSTGAIRDPGGNEVKTSGSSSTGAENSGYGGFGKAGSTIIKSGGN